jgi:hypothetical protein
MPADRTRRTTTSRDAAEAAFKAATTKPAELPPKPPTIPNAKELVSLRIDRDVLDHFQEADRAGKTGSMRRCERYLGSRSARRARNDWCRVLWTGDSPRGDNQPHTPTDSAVAGVAGPRVPTVRGLDDSSHLLGEPHGKAWRPRPMRKRTQK